MGLVAHTWKEEKMQMLLSFHGWPRQPLLSRAISKILAKLIFSQPSKRSSMTEPSSNSCFSATIIFLPSPLGCLRRHAPLTSCTLFFFFFFFFLLYSFFLLPPFAAALTSFEYHDFKLDASRGISVDGDAFVDGGAINLNMDIEGGYSVGRAYYSNPIRLWDASSGVLTNFTTAFTFEVSFPVGKGSNISGGMSFFLAANANVPPFSSGGYLGLVSNSSSFNATGSSRFVAVEFDSFGSKWEINRCSCHVGINVNSIKSDVHANMNISTFNPGPKGNARVLYDALTRNLSVLLDYDETLYGLSDVVNLPKFLSEWVYVGFSGSTGATSDLKKITSWRFESSLDSPKSGKRINIMAIAISLSIALLLMASGLVIWRFRTRRSQGENGGKVASGKEDDSIESREFERVPRSIPYVQLATATENFKREWRVGYGASGEVYRGFLKDLNWEVAIKKLAKDSWQREREFVSEVKIIGHLRHRNLVELIGWCHEKNERLIVYEFMPNGSLDLHLFNANNLLLSWRRRYNIAKGVASAIFYLHEGWQKCIVHRDIKCSNIMLDEDFIAKLGDFGLARLTAHGSALQSTLMAGTLAYMAPEIFMAGKANLATDIYSFGIVALEIACGRKGVEPREEKGKESLIHWLWELYARGSIMDAADKKLGVAIDEREMERLMLVGLWCAHPEATSRPSIRQVVTALNFEVAVPDLYATPTSMASFQYLLSSKNASSSSLTTKSTVVSSTSASTSKPMPFPSR